MLTKLNVTCVFLICVQLLNRTANTATCNAPDLASLNMCLSKAATGNLTIDLCGANIELTSQISISNSGFSLLIQNGSLSGNSSNFRILSISPNSELSLCRVTIENGYATGIDDNGGGIFNLGKLSLLQTTLSHNKADNSGGSIYNGSTGTLAIDESWISGSAAKGNSGANSGGGGIFNTGTITFIADSTISGNATRGLGAGINNQGIIELICGSTISHNLNCILVPGSGECEIGQSPTGAGGGLFNETLATVELLINSTIAKNISLQGGGIFNNGAISGITNSTLAHNNVNFGGGGIYNNTGATIGELTSDIVAENIDTNELTLIAPDVLNLGTIVSESYNFIGNNKGVLTIIDGQNNDIVGSYAHLLDLQDNGGPAFTMALDPRSRAINNGLNPHDLEFDQRNTPFRRVVLGRPDIGAYELQAEDCEPCSQDREGPCSEHCPKPEPSRDHPSEGSFGWVPPLVPVLPPVPVPVPVPVVPDVPVITPLPEVSPVEVCVTKDETEASTKISGTPVDPTEKESGCSTISHRSQSTHLMLMILLVYGALRNLRARYNGKERSLFKI